MTALSPKLCECGLQAKIWDSRQVDGYVVRRYRCSCGCRWTSREVRVDDSGNSVWSSDGIVSVKEEVADRLIEMAQSLLR